MAADIADICYPVVPEIVLQVEAVLLHQRKAIRHRGGIGRVAETRRANSGRAECPGIRIKYTGEHVTRRPYERADASQPGILQGVFLVEWRWSAACSRIGRQVQLVIDQEVPVNRVIKPAIAGADYQPLAERLPGDSDARGEIMQRSTGDQGLVAIDCYTARAAGRCETKVLYVKVGRHREPYESSCVAQCLESRARIYLHELRLPHIGELAALVVREASIFPAQAKVDGKLRADFDVVLNVPIELIDAVVVRQGALQSEPKNDTARRSSRRAVKR